MTSPFRYIIGFLWLPAIVLCSLQGAAQMKPDSSFSGDGIRIDTNTNTNPYPIRYDKLVELHGGSYVGGGHNGIHKVLANGEKDAGFGVGGAANFPVINGYNYDGVPCVRSIAVQRDGKIVVLAQVQYAGQVNPFMCLLRFTAGGATDVTFHGTG